MGDLLLTTLPSPVPDPTPQKKNNKTNQQ
jgi:hypothetical protein